MPNRYAEIRSAVLEHLRRCREGDLANGTYEAVTAILKKRSQQTLDQADIILMEQVFHDLYLERIIVPSASAGMVQDEIGKMSWPKYRVTEFGVSVLGSKEYVPYDPDGYLAQLKKDIPEVDPIVIMYLEEALVCFRTGCLLAAAVMMGCAAEKVMLQLIDAFGQAISDPKSNRKYLDEVQGRIISKKYAALWNRLQRIQESLPADLSDDLHVHLDRVFDLIRTARNEAGHPTGKMPSRESVHANFILFPTYCRQVYGLISYFSDSRRRSPSIPIKDK